MTKSPALDAPIGQCAGQSPVLRNHQHCIA